MGKRNGDGGGDRHRKKQSCEGTGDDDDHETDVEESGHRSERRERKKRRSRKYSNSSINSSGGSEDEDERSHDDEDTATSASCDSASEHDDRRHRKRDRSRHKKRKKKDQRKKRKKERKRDRGSKKEREKRKWEDDDDRGQASRRGNNKDRAAFLKRNREVADSLLSLLSSHPAFAADLPIMLVRMAGGASFNLSQMTDSSARTELERVFGTLVPFGVTKVSEDSSFWVWKPPSSGDTCGPLSNRKSHELVLVRVVRGLLDQMGLTAAAVDAYEANNLDEKKPRASQPSPTVPAVAATAAASPLDAAERLTKDLLSEFWFGKVADDLATLVDGLLGGESVSLDRVPDAALRHRLEQLIGECGLELQGMEKQVPGAGPKVERQAEVTASRGYAIPRGNRTAEALCRAKLATILRICREDEPVAAGKDRRSTRRPTQGPLRDPSAYAEAAAGSSSDDEGPAPRTSVSAKRQDSPKITPEALKAQADRRALELECAKAGVEAPPLASSSTEEGQREEWMLVPGKFDFLDSVQSGQSMRGRAFENKRGGGKDTASSEALDPAVRAEIEQIMQAHEQSRGPSLMEMHQQKKKAEKDAAAIAATNRGSSSRKAAWKWNRDRDLESGRGVDRNALNRVYGEASSDLKNKFHGGFG
jgi:hypothetical protein